MASYQHCPDDYPLSLRSALVRTWQGRAFLWLLLFCLSISKFLVFFPREASVCHVAWTRHAPTCFQTYAAELIERFLVRIRRRPYDISVMGTLRQSDPATDEGTEKKTKHECNAGKTRDMRTSVWLRNVCTCLGRHFNTISFYLSFFFLVFSCQLVGETMVDRILFRFSVDVSVSGTNGVHLMGHAIKNVIKLSTGFIINSSN